MKGKKFSTADHVAIKQIVRDVLREEKVVTEPDLKHALEEFKNEFKNIVIGFKDEILKEIQNLRVDVTIVTGYKDQIEDHEDRITKLEKHPAISTP